MQQESPPDLDSLDNVKRRCIPILDLLNWEVFPIPENQKKPYHS